MTIPSKFKIGGQDFIVEEIDNIQNGELFGQFNCALNKIFIANRIQVDDIWYTVNAQIKEQTFYHELMHVFHYLWNTEIPEDEAQVYGCFMLEFEQTKE